MTHPLLDFSDLPLFDQVQPAAIAPAIDSLLGATAAHHGLTMVTRNRKDFKNLGLNVFNPWTD